MGTMRQRQAVLRGAAGAAAALLLAAGCISAPGPAPEAAAVVGEGPTLTASPTVSPVASMPANTAPPSETPTGGPTPSPAGAVLNLRSARHESGVFSLSVPAGWEEMDHSADQRLLVSYVPPVGYGSRVTVDVTNEGPLPPTEVRALAESYVHLHYVSQPGYTEISRAELPDGRLQFVFQYSDGQGAQGRETLIIQQAGPYFAALRVFLSSADGVSTGQALEAITASFVIDPLVVWGTGVTTVASSDLPITGTTLWQDKDGVTYYMGEVRNASPVSVAGVEVRVALCDEGGIVMAEIVEKAALDQVLPGGSTPFAVRAEGLPSGVVVCAEQATASPAGGDRTYMSALTLRPRAGFDDDGRVVIEGEVSNPSLAPVTNIEVVLLVYGADDRLVGYHLIGFGPDVTLAPGETATFAHTFPELGGLAERFATLAEGRVAIFENPSLAPGSGGS